MRNHKVAVGPLLAELGRWPSIAARQNETQRPWRPTASDPDCVKTREKSSNKKIDLLELPLRVFLDIGKGHPNHGYFKFLRFTQPGPIADGRLRLPERSVDVGSRQPCLTVSLDYSYGKALKEQFFSLQLSDQWPHLQKAVNALCSKGLGFVMRNKRPPAQARGKGPRVSGAGDAVETAVRWLRHLYLLHRIHA
jgi:hypothetical protein